MKTMDDPRIEKCLVHKKRTKYLALCGPNWYGVQIIRLLREDEICSSQDSPFGRCSNLVTKTFADKEEMMADGYILA